MKTLKIRRQKLLKKISKNINKNLLLSKKKQEIKRQRKRLIYLDNYKLNSIIKCAQYNFNNLTSFNKNKRDNRNKRNCKNINLENCKKN